jgi:hypothetical protein
MIQYIIMNHVPHSEETRSEPNYFKRQVTAFVASITLAAAVGAIQHDSESAAEPIKGYNPHQISQLELGYPELSGSDYAEHMYDEEASNESSVVYRHEGLESLSFARPTLEIARKIIEADNVQEIADAATPFLESLGMNLYVNLPHPQLKWSEVIPVQQEDLEYAKTAMLTTLTEIAITPREVIELANIKDVVFAHDIFTSNGQVAGVAYMWPDQHPGILAIDVTADRYGHRATWHHEIAHHLDKALTQLTKNGFRHAYLKLNPTSFIYKKQPIESFINEEKFQELIQQALASKVVVSAYSAEAFTEDIAESYPTLWSDELAPSPDDDSYGYAFGAKRVLWIETLEDFVPGFKAYLIGLSTTAQYAFESVPYSLQEYERSLKMYSR